MCSTAYMWLLVVDLASYMYHLRQSQRSIHLTSHIHNLGTTPNGPVMIYPSTPLALNILPLSGTLRATSLI